MTVLRVTAHMAAPVALRDDAIHLDSLLCAAHPDVRGRHVTRANRASDLSFPQLPVARIRAAGSWIYAASAGAFPAESKRGRENLTARKDPEDIARRDRPWSPSAGPERAYMVPVPTVETPSVSWLAVGSRQGVRQLLRYVDHVGGWRRHGYGAVCEWTVEAVDLPASAVLLLDGRTQRHLPAEWVAETPCAQIDHGAVLPPYWHPGLAVSRYRSGSLALSLSAPVHEALDRCR